MDVQSTIGDAFSYIMELKTKVKALPDELKDFKTGKALEISYYITLKFLLKEKLNIMKLLIEVPVAALLVIPL